MHGAARVCNARRREHLPGQAESTGEVDVNVVDSEGRSALHVACTHGHYAAARWLIRRGAMLDAIDPHGRTPLVVAVRGHHDRLIPLLVEEGAHLGLVLRNPEAPGSAQSITARAVSGAWGDSAAARTTCACGGRAPTAVAEMKPYIFRGDVAGAKRLLAAGLSPDELDSHGRGFLHEAASMGHAALVEVLLRAGGDPNLADDSGRTPLLEAVHNEYDRVCECLVRGGAVLGLLEVDWRELTWRAPDAVLGKTGRPMRASLSYMELAQAASTGAEGRLRRLLDCGCSANATDLNGRTALHLACLSGNLTAAIMLVRAGGDMHLEDRQGHTPHAAAVDSGHAELAQVLAKLQREAPPQASAYVAGPAGSVDRGMGRSMWRSSATSGRSE